MFLTFPECQLNSFPYVEHLYTTSSLISPLLSLSQSWYVCIYVNFSSRRSAWCSLPPLEHPTLVLLRALGAGCVPLQLAPDQKMLFQCSRIEGGEKIHTVAYQQTACRDRADAGAQTYRDKNISHWAVKSRFKNTLTKINLLRASIKPTLFHEEQLFVS